MQRLIDGHEEDGVEQDWTLYYSDENDRGEGRFTFQMSDIASLYFFDMSNKSWQDFLAA
ncbi:glycoside hydrolase family 66 protein [Shouchella miscanthi]|uniref:Glycoside hydrolase family 66 protein n=1 Tax=Shouchella miscanthi TaxID=2598861 RepID=A0ABU6NNN1_9BACI|nr:glycoside hydrolase family 66 protein [Shouchella miscanthi]